MTQMTVAMCIFMRTLNLPYSSFICHFKSLPFNGQNQVMMYKINVTIKSVTFCFLTHAIAYVL